MSPLNAFRRTLDQLWPKPTGPFKNLKIALISDELTALCLGYESQIRHITPRNYRVVFETWRPDLLLVESAWHGRKNAWKFRIASYDGQPQRNNNDLRQVVTNARDLGIPCAFWNKEDGVHFSRFIDSASLFNYIFTVDENAIPKYRNFLGKNTQINTLMFSIQPALHSPGENTYRYHKACFVGSYSQHIHTRRRMWQDMLFSATRELGLTIYDRNSDRKSPVYRYPQHPWIDMHKRIDHGKTARIYRDHMICLNVNTVEDSPTMFSRRFLEILACGGLAVSTPALSLRQHFFDFCHIVASQDDALGLFELLRGGWRPIDKEMAQAGSEHVLQHHTWRHRLGEILQVIPVGKRH